MFKRILVPLDGSRLAERAFHVAAHLARRTGGTVLAVRVVSPPAASWPFAAPLLPSAAVQTFLEAERWEAGRYLEHLTHTSTLAEEQISDEVHTGPAAATLLALADERDVDLIVLSSHGSTSPSRWKLGSVAEKVARHATVPVLLLPDDAGSTPPLSPWHAFVPLDGSAAAEAALAPASCLASALAEPGQAILHLLLVATFPASVGGEEQTALSDAGMDICLHRETEQYLSAVRERFARDQEADHRVSLTSSLHVSRDVAEAVLTCAEQGDTAAVTGGCGAGGIALIAMTTCGREGSRSWMMGHVTARVLNATSLPFLLVPLPRSERATHPRWMLERERGALPV